MEKLVTSLGIISLSKSNVSVMASELDTPGTDSAPAHSTPGRLGIVHTAQHDM